MVGMRQMSCSESQRVWNQSSRDDGSSVLSGRSWNRLGVWRFRGAIGLSLCSNSEESKVIINQSGDVTVSIRSVSEKQKVSLESLRVPRSESNAPSPRLYISTFQRHNNASSSFFSSHVAFSIRVIATTTRSASAQVAGHRCTGTPLRMLWPWEVKHSFFFFSRAAF
jgi:hypothetical protein